MSHLRSYNMDQALSSTFYDALPRINSFDQLVGDTAYQALPDDWFVGVADIEGSTEEILAGRYKTVNMVGAAVISGQRNTSGDRAFPFIFGGDGAAFAFWPEHEMQARETLAAVQCWALEEFGIRLRTAIVPVKDIRAAGHDVKVARYEASPNADYAMFTGGGVAWAENEMKRGAYAVTTAPAGTIPNLEGLSCRWTPMKAQHGTILSVLISPQPNAAPEKLAALLSDVVQLEEQIRKLGNPAREETIGTAWPPKGLDLEVHASRNGGSFFKRKLALLAETFLAWIFFKFKLKLENFDPQHYARTVGLNADFRKFDDGLKMTLDCDPASRERLQTLLSEAEREGVIRYGLFEQEEALMTCIVPSPYEDDHVHFVDGASGGYAMAARRLKGEGA